MRSAGLMLVLCAALPCGVMGARAQEARETPEATEDGVARFAFGDWAVTAIQDSAGRSGLGVLRNLPPGAAEELFPDGSYPGVVNVFVLQAGPETILFDTGNGPGTGAALPRLAAAGIAPEKVTRILITHGHFDHVGGLAKDGQALFPNATVFIPAEEHAYWIGDGTAPAPAGEAGTRLREALAAYGGKVVRFAQGTEIVPGVKAVALFGHTPGHTGFLLARAERKLLIWGDIMHCLPAQIRYPDVTLTYDVDQAMAAATRREILKRAAREEWSVAGMHLPFPGIGALKERDGGFEYLPGF